ncbi:LacI family DNA-binding transcriptional regulator [Enterococcus olivae]
MKKTSMQDIADALGISRNSVSQALRGKSGVSKSTQISVKKKADELGYQYNEHTLQNDKKKILLIATEFAFSQLSFFGEIIKSMENVCKTAGHNLQNFVLTSEILLNQKLPKDLNSFDGIIILSHSSNSYIKKIIDSHLPVILVDHHDPSLLADAILSKNTDGAFQAVSLLADHGHKRIGFIGDIDFSPSYLERYRGYQRAFKEFNFTHEEDIELIQIEETQGALFTKLKKIQHMPDAWFCVNSGLAFMLNNYLQTAGYTIPDDIGIICFDDTEFTRMAVPQITNVATNLQYMGQLVIKVLLERIADPTAPFTHHQIVPQLNVRESIKIN